MAHPRGFVERRLFFRCGRRGMRGPGLRFEFFEHLSITSTRVPFGASRVESDERGSPCAQRDRGSRFEATDVVRDTSGPGDDSAGIADRRMEILESFRMKRAKPLDFRFRVVEDGRRPGQGDFGAFLLHPA